MGVMKKKWRILKHKTSPTLNKGKGKEEHE